MAEQPQHEKEPKETEEKRGGQVLGCVFAVFAVGFIFFGLFIFMRYCG